MTKKGSEMTEQEAVSKTIEYLEKRERCFTSKYYEACKKDKNSKEQKHLHSIMMEFRDARNDLVNGDTNRAILLLISIIASTQILGDENGELLVGEFPLVVMRNCLEELKSVPRKHLELVRPKTSVKKPRET